MIPLAGLPRGTRRFLFCIVTFWLVMYAAVLTLAALGDIHAIRVIGIVVGSIAIPLGLGLIAWMLSRPPFRETKPRL